MISGWVPRLEISDDQRLYELWIFYKVLECLPVKLTQDRNDPQVFRAEKDPKLKIIYEEQNQIDWMRIDEQGKVSLRRTESAGQ